jgi:hypothetical protein
VINFSLDPGSFGSGTGMPTGNSDGFRRQTKKRLQLPKRHNGNPGIVGQAIGIEQLADAPSAQFATTTFKLYDF